MYITAEIIKDILETSFQITEYGKRLQRLSLKLPSFFMKDTVPEADGVYIARSSDLPDNLLTECLYICFGNIPVGIRHNCRAQILYLSGSYADYLNVYNAVHKIYDKILQWECKMQDILKNSCDIEEMLAASIPVFENRITIIDYNLKILAYCEATTINGKKENKINHSYEILPCEKSLLFGSNNKNRNFSHAPYHFVEPDTGTDNYCINLFLDSEYVGTCSLMEDCRPIRKSDYLLFQKFSEYITSALKKQTSRSGGKYITLKTILGQLLESMPVSKSQLDQALESISLAHGGYTLPEHWICITFQSANKNKQLPDGYLCSTIEQFLPDCFVLSFEGNLVCVLPASGTPDETESFFKTFSAFLQDMNFHAGCSLLFHNLFKLQIAYQQALHAINIGKTRHPDKLFFVFRDYLLDYMLQNCCGAFEPQDLLIPELDKLLHSKHSVDYWNTLKSYLDHECNASETAHAMFLHRSSLLPRLKKIREIVNFDSPESRLLLRIYMYLYDNYSNFPHR